MKAIGACSIGSRYWFSWLLNILLSTWKKINWYTKRIRCIFFEIRERVSRPQNVNTIKFDKKRKHLVISPHFRYLFFFRWSHPNFPQINRFRSKYICYSINIYYFSRRIGVNLRVVQSPSLTFLYFKSFSNLNLLLCAPDHGNEIEKEENLYET